MNDNPYTAPETEVQDESVESGSADFKHLNWKELKKFYYRSCNVSGLAALMVIGILGSIFMVISGMFEGMLVTLILTILIFNFVSVIGIIMRTKWGRIMGIISCCIMLISIPWGTIIGIMGLFAFGKCPELFGEDRVLHRDIKTEFKHRKKNKIFD